MVKLSVIMPAFNVERYIEKSVESVMEQTLKEIELIIVNDASTDSTWDKICKLKEKFGNKICAINLEHNLRQGGARNVGIKNAKGEYIAFVDSDDWIRKDMLETFYTSIVDSDADLVGTGSYFIYYNDYNIREVKGDKRLISELSGVNANQEIRNKYCFLLGGIWRNLFKKEVIIGNNIWFPEGLSYEDNYFVNLYISYVKKYICVPEAFYYYRQHENSSVHRKDLTQLQRIQIEKLLLNEYKKRNIYEEIKDGYDLMCIKRWYINTLGVLFCRIGKEGIKLSRQIGNEFREYFPDYKSNKFYRTEITKVDKIKLSLFEISPHLLYLLYFIKEKKHAILKIKKN